MKRTATQHHPAFLVDSLSTLYNLASGACVNSSTFHKPLQNMSEALGFIGLGAMGAGMAANIQRLLRSDHAPVSVGSKDLYLYNRTSAKAESLVSDPQLRCQLTGSAAELCSKSSIVFLMLADDVACDTVLQQLCSTGLTGKVVVNHSTNTPDFAKSATSLVTEAGGVYLSAPVWGRPDAAAEGRLIVVPAGPAEAVQRVQPYLEAHGRLLPQQDAPYKANVMKLIGNFMLFGFVETMCEGFTLADKNSVPRDDILAFIDAFFPAPPIQGYARRVATESLDAGAGFTVDLALKDVRYMRQLAENSRSPSPTADLVFNSLLQASANGYGHKDVGAMFLAVQQSAGLLKQGAHLEPKQ